MVAAMRIQNGHWQCTYMYSKLCSQKTKRGGHDRRHPILVLYEDINQKLTKYLEFT